MVGLEGHDMAGTGIVVSGHRCRCAGRLGDRVMYLAPSTVAPGRATRECVSLVSGDLVDIRTKLYVLIIVLC